MRTLARLARIVCLCVLPLTHATSTAAQTPPQLLPPAPGAQPPAPGTPPVVTVPTVPAPVATSPLSLDLDAGNLANVPLLTRPDNGVITIGLIYSGKAATNATVSVSPFTSDNGSGSVTPSIVNCLDPAKPGAREAAVPLTPNRMAPICLSFPALPPGSAKFNGRLVVTLPDGPAPYPRTIAVSPPPQPQGTLVLDRLVVNDTIDLPFFSRAAESTISIHAREKTSKISLEGVTVNLEQVSSPPHGFDLRRNVHFFLTKDTKDAGAKNTDDGDTGELDVNADEIASPDPSRGSSTVRIPAGGQVQIGLRLHDLEPGEYVAVLHFGASNSADDPSQKLQLNLHVRDSVWWAVWCLVGALIVSFIATKVLTSERRRAAILQQIRSLQPAWLAALPPAPAVVWTQAVLHKARRLSGRFFLTSPELIEASVASVTSVLGLLDAARQLHGRLSIALDKILAERAAFALERITSRIGAGPQDDATIQRIKADLSSFEDWLSRDKFPVVFWNDILPSLQALQASIVDAELPQIARDVVKEIKDAIDAAMATAPTTRDKVEEIYRKYTTLKTIWDERGDLAGLMRPPLETPDALRALASDPTRFLQLADDRIWQRVKDEQTPLAIRMPVASDPDGLEAYGTIQFSVESADSLVDNSFLFRHRVEYHWTFTLEPILTMAERVTARVGRRQPAAVVLTPISLGPSIVQYFPRPGTVFVDVTLTYRGQSRTLPRMSGPKIQKSSDYAIYKILAGTEMTSWLVAGIVAIATGLSTYYFKGTSWGSFQDYLTLFLWGVGVDQGKNFLQALQSFSGSGASSTK